MTDDLVHRARMGDLTGLHIAGLVRLSFEVDDSEVTAAGAGSKQKFRPASGRDIKGRDEQEKDNRRYVESRGGSYVYTYDEPDTSAWRRKKVRQSDGSVGYRVIRPVFEGALDDLKRGTTPDGQRLDGLIVYDIDRLTRDPRHLEDAIEVVQNFGRPIIDITGTLDLLTDNGRTVARLLVTVANKQSADTGRRVRRKHMALQQAGIPTGGTRPFGWKDDKRTLEPKEAEAIRKAVRRLTEGAPIRAVIQEWNEAGLRGTKGGKWSSVTFKQVLRNPRICGYRSREVIDFDPATGTENRYLDVVLDDHGNPVRGQWEKIIEPEEWRLLTARLGAAPAPGDGRNARKYLCTGILRCWKPECGARLRVSKHLKSRGGNHPEGYFYYICPPKADGGCGGLRVPGPEVDKLVTKMVIAKYEEEAAARSATAAPASWEKEDELARLREDIEDWKQARAARQVTKERFFAFLAEAERKERELLRERNEWQRKAATNRGKPIDLRATWDDLSFVEKRAYVERALAAVIVGPAVGRKRPVRDRLTPVFRGDE